jgi:hypothetical protein
MPFSLILQWEYFPQDQIDIGEVYAKEKFEPSSSTPDAERSY